MTDAFLHGIIAGYGIAIPVGAIAVLIVTTAARESFRQGVVAGLGAATADLTYAAVAAAAGSALSSELRNLRTPLHAVGGCVLLAVGCRGLVRATRLTQIEAEPPRPNRDSVTYVRFLALTLINPLTVIYFSSVVLGNQAATGVTTDVAFVCGVGLASASWQTLLAGSGAIVGRTLVDRGRVATAALGYGVVLLIGLGQLLRL